MTVRTAMGDRRPRGGGITPLRLGTVDFVTSAAPTLDDNCADALVSALTVLMELEVPGGTELLES